LGLVVWVIVGTLVLAPRVISVTGAVGPADMALSVGPARRGALAVDVPPLGSVRAPTHKGPVEVDLSIRRLNQVEMSRLRLDRSDRDSGVDALGDQIAVDLRSLLIRFAVFGSLEAGLIGAVAAALFPRRGARSIVVGALVGGVTFVALGAAAVPGFDASQFKTATVNGSLESASALVESLGSLGTVDARAAALSDRLADLYSASAVESLASPGDTVILHISDLHLNPIGLRLARQLAAEIGADAIIDTGDTTSFGLGFEGGFADLVSDFEVPYYWVAGNHDSAAVRAAIAAAPGVTALDGEPVRIDELVVSGVDDPTYTALRRPDIDEWRAEYASHDDETVDVVERQRPDLLAVHNPVQASPVLGQVDTVIAGHTHSFSIGERDGTTLEVVASSGATGLGRLLVEDDLPYGFAILRYDGTRLVAIDQAEFDGLNGSFTLRRHIPGDGGERAVEDLVTEPAPEADASEMPEATAPTPTSSVDESNPTGPAEAPSTTDSAGVGDG
jgi:predicted phosphodiesterase